jgi:hypothetical protein
MTFLLSPEILSAMGGVDFLATLALTETSGTLNHFIFEHVLTATMLCEFLRQNQYALYHDLSGSLFSNRELLLLHRAFEVLRKRQTIIYDELSIPLLGALLARTPLCALEKSPTTRAKPWSPKILFLDRSSHDHIPINDRRTVYGCLSEISWLHSPINSPLIGTLPKELPYRYRRYERVRKSYLRTDFLFCKRYMDDIAACLKLIQPLIGVNLRLSRDPPDKRVAKIQSLISGKEMKLTFKRFYIKAFIHRICYLEDFQAV